ncbi:hypothetical protein [Halorarum salinum]|uniref:Uncharacterized protein n=1 Tax=Halorarum salinum TaxID=2743089 RepID=A0A7D5QBY5_9EURY|nr:hypothetical protein [Halobaculum salinum]QLG62918.1 hypothetical protein HUG12_14740 [Halobaculum salinum]
MSTERRIPDRLVGPLGGLSLLVGLASIVLAYIFIIIGTTLYFDMNGLDGVTRTDSIIVLVTGVLLVGVAYAGYKGFMRFAT